MDCDEEEIQAHATAPADTNSGNAAVNSLILDYYKKFGRKRDLEQYFSLSTAQNEVKDTSGTFWQRMKSENDSSDSGGKKSDSSQELCRISIRCSVPDPCSSQYHAKPTKPILTGSALLESLGIHVNPMEEDSKTKSESVSPPIITEEVPQDATQNSDDESVKSYGNNSQKSFDILDSSTNKPHSPTSSITSQRKLEWDSLADVGYANESDRKTSASSLSTLERLALKQQYSNNDTKLDSVLEPPTAHSTPLEDSDVKTKPKKGVGKKSTKIYKKDVDYLEVNMPHSSENNTPQTINVNLTKHISFNVEKDGKVSVDNIQKDVSVSPEKVAETASPGVKMDKEMQTSLNKSKDPSSSKTIPQKIPVLISLNTLRRQNRRRKLRMARKKLMSKKKVNKENISVQEKSGEQLSEAESFEYMPGHMYNQNQMAANERSGTTAGNKSSLESSGLLTTDSSKGSKHSFTKDLEKSIDILRAALQKGGDDTNLRKQLIKQVCERLLKSKYRDDESSSEFLSGLSFSSKKLGLGERNHTTTSTSDNSAEKLKRPKKSILRNDKFNAGAIASTSQSAPNLPTASNSEKLVSSNLMKNLTSSNTDSDLSHKEKSSSDNVFVKTSSQELYQLYIDALKREENYKRHLKDKEMFLKQKLVCSDSAIRAPIRPDPKVNSRLKDLIKDLTRNNYDDGSGDASKLEGGPNSSRDTDRFVPIRSQRSHSVFTLSSGNSDQNKQNLKKRLKCDLKDMDKPGTSKEHYCCCPHHSSKSKACLIDSSVQVNLSRCDDTSCEKKNPSPIDKASARAVQRDSPKSTAKMVTDDSTGDIKYVCLCNNKTIQDVPNNCMIFKCSRLAKGNQETSSNSSCRSRNISPRKNMNKDTPKPPTVAQCTDDPTRNSSPQIVCCMKTTTKSSQTNFLLKMLRRRSSDHSPPLSCESMKCSRKECSSKVSHVPSKVYEATRWLQTEISINPRIPEPSLSDINIVTDCANIVSEHCRAVSKPSLTDVFTCKQTVETSCNSGSSKSSGTSKEIGELFDDDNACVEKPKTFETKNDNQGSGSEHSEKYTIPIQGTNMTLMVSIGSNELKNKPEEMVGQCIGTDKHEMTEQGTCLAEECSKGVQYNTSRPSSGETDHNSNNVGIPKDRFKSSCTVNTCLTAKEPTFNTFPKTSPVNDRKPFKRANTDTDNFGKCVTPVNLDKYAQPPAKERGDENKCNEKLKTKKCEITPVKKASVEKETQCSKPNSPKCSCSCDRNMKDCSELCDERKKCLTSLCSCGCLLDKDKCNKCEKRSDECPCGCSGTIDKCNRICNEPKASLSVVKESEISYCSCGCGRDKGECNSNCIESKITLPAEKDSVSVRCSCGCDGNIKNCKKNCKERKKSTSIQCSCGCSGDKEVCNKNCDKNNLKEIGIQKDVSSSCSGTPRENDRKSKAPDKQNACNLPSTSKNICEADSDRLSDKCQISESETEKDPILEMIQNITNKYSKNDFEKTKRKKCFKEIMNVLKYLLETEDSTDRTDNQCITSESSNKEVCEKPEKKSPPKKNEKPCQKPENPSQKPEKPYQKPEKPCLKPEKCCQKPLKPSTTESSDCPQSTDIPGTSSDSATCKVLNKIKKECERYHQKRCKAYSGKKCDISSSTSAHCEQCRRVHHCSCRSHKCKGHKKCDKIQKKAVAYNLILQASESISEETVCDNKRQLKNVVVKVPAKKKDCCNVPFQEMCDKIKSRMPCSPQEAKPSRSRSLPNESEISSMEEFMRKSQACCTVREYLEQNRPDFITKSSERQTCMRIISNSRANMRAAQRELLSVRLAQLSDVNDLDSAAIRQLAQELGRHMRQKRPAPKFISERAMKKHSENIYKSLPEVVQKKEEAKKEDIKKTNLLMANIFKRNLQKKTLRGSVDISNYSPIIKI